MTAFSIKKFKKQYAFFPTWFKEQKHEEIKDTTRHDLDKNFDLCSGNQIFIFWLFPNSDHTALWPSKKVKKNYNPYQ